jgi:type VI secretion system secreted protein VgrG
VRVSSAWAGQGYGGVQIPRVGDEVVVDFINGDPDRPIITGRVYNDASMPPWALPAAATQMGFLSRSKDGTASTANALRFEDKAGSEQVWLHAERNLDVDVENDENHNIDKNHTHFVGENEEQRVVKNQTVGVKGEAKTLTGGNMTESVVNTYTLRAGQEICLQCGDSSIRLTQAGNIDIVGKTLNITISGQGDINAEPLNLNSGNASTLSAPGTGDASAIQQDLDSFFVFNANKE